MPGSYILSSHQLGVAVVVVVLTVVEDDEALIIQTSCEDSELHSLQLFE